MIDRDIQKVCMIAVEGQNKVLFRKSHSTCTICHKPLEVYYAEDGVYAVRCSKCEIVAILRATNPTDAAGWVGVEKPHLRHAIQKEAKPNE